MRRIITLTLGVVVALALSSVGAAFADNPTPDAQSSRGTSTLAVYGDAPYGTTPTDTAEFDATPAFIDSVNADPDVDLVLHVGDIHSGKQFCTQAYDQSVFDLWTRVPATRSSTRRATTSGPTATRRPRAATCSSTASRSTTPTATRLRTSRSSGRSSSRTPDCRSVSGRRSCCRRDSRSIGVIRPTRSSSRTSSGPSRESCSSPSTCPAGRTTTRTSGTALRPRPRRRPRSGPSGPGPTCAGSTPRSPWRASTHAKGVVIGAQADMWDPEKGAAHQAGYEPFVQSVASHTLHFGRPGADVQRRLARLPLGQPAVPTAPCTWESADPCASVASMHPGYDVPNFHRVVVHGSTFPLEWLKLTVDPHVNRPAGPTRSARSVGSERPRADATPIGTWLT